MRKTDLNYCKFHPKDLRNRKKDLNKRNVYNEFAIWLTIIYIYIYT